MNGKLPKGTGLHLLDEARFRSVGMALPLTFQMLRGFNHIIRQDGCDHNATGNAHGHRNGADAIALELLRLLVEQRQGGVIEVAARQQGDDARDQKDGDRGFHEPGHDFAPDIDRNGGHQIAQKQAR